MLAKYSTRCPRSSREGPVKAETCDQCGTHSKIVFAEKDADAEVFADDLAILALDILVDEAGGGPRLTRFRSPAPADRYPLISLSAMPATSIRARRRSCARLTGIDTDRLPEEKARGGTIDLGFAYRAVPGIGAPDSVDECFVHNMVAGAPGVDFGLRVVAADDGPMPQTREHLQIVDLLGIERGLVGLSKSDLVHPKRTAEVSAALRGCPPGSRTTRSADPPPCTTALESTSFWLQKLAR